MQRLLFVTYDFPPCTEIGALSCAQITRNLPDHGWEPIVLSVREQYYDFLDPQLRPPARVIRTRVLPHPLALYERARALGCRTATAGASPSRSSHGITSSMTAAARDLIVSLLDSPDRYTGWIPPAVLAGVSACRQFDITHVKYSGPWWTNQIVGLLVARLAGVSWIAHFRDPWTHWCGWSTESRVRRAVRTTLERRVVTRADAVVCVTDHHTSLLQRIYPHLPASKFVTIPNGYDEAEWSDIVPESRHRPGTRTDEFVVTYGGTLEDKRDPAPVFRAVRRLLDNGEIETGKIHFDFIGRCQTVQGRPLEEVAADSGLAACLRRDGVLSKGETLRRFVSSDLLLLLAEDWPLQIPAKSYEYLRAGLPVLALAPPDGAVAALFRRTGGAWVVDHSNDIAIECALREAYSSWKRGQPARVPDVTVVATFERGRLAGELAALLRQVTHPQPARV